MVDTYHHLSMSELSFEKVKKRSIIRFHDTIHFITFSPLLIL